MWLSPGNGRIGRLDFIYLYRVSFRFTVFVFVFSVLGNNIIYVTVSYGFLSPFYVILRLPSAKTILIFFLTNPDFNPFSFFFAE